MNFKKVFFFLLYFAFSILANGQKADPYKADFNPPTVFSKMKLVWNDEFNKDGKPDSANWKYEHGFVRNNELQWYQPDNATCKNGLLVIEGRREQIVNPDYNANASDWRSSRQNSLYTSASLNTGGLHHFKFGRFIIRAKIDTATGSWPAIWTLGINGEWPSNGEVDLMEFYRINSVPTILANLAWGTNVAFKAKWDTKRTALSKFTKVGSDWVNKFHTWRMDWDKNSIKLFLDDELLNTVHLSETINADSTNPFLQPHYLLLNLALGANGGEPVRAVDPIKFKVDYIRVYQQKQ